MLEDYTLEILIPHVFFAVAVREDLKTRGIGIFSSSKISQDFSFSLKVYQCSFSKSLKILCVKFIQALY